MHMKCKGHKIFRTILKKKNAVRGMKISVACILDLEVEVKFIIHFVEESLEEYLHDLYVTKITLDTKSSNHLKKK